VVIRQNVQRGIPTRPILFVSVVLAVVALALSGLSGLKTSTAPVHVVKGASVTTIMAPDAQERNQQILQSRNASHSNPNPTYHFQ
jgi:hypothetical protein